MRGSYLCGVSIALIVLTLVPMAQAQSVEHIVRHALLAETGGTTTTDGPPSCVVDSTGNLHVVYSTNNAAETRADLYYRRVSFSRDVVGRVEGIGTVGPAVCLTAGLGSYDSVDPALSDSFHMTPVLAIDGQDRIHVLFCGYGGVDKSVQFNRYSSELTYLNFAAPAAEYGTVDVNVTSLVDNAYDADLDHSAEMHGYFTDYSRTRPAISIERRANGPLVHVACISRSGWDSTEGADRPRLTYLRFSVGTDGATIDTDADGVPDDLAKLHVEQGNGGVSVESALRCGVYALGDGAAQLIGAYNWDDPASTWDPTFRHFVVDVDGGGVLTRNSLWTSEIWRADFAAAVGSDGVLRLVPMAAAGTLHEITSGFDETGEAVVSFISTAGQFPADSSISYGSGQGAVVLGDELFALHNAGGEALHLAEPGHDYTVAVTAPGRHSFDLVTLGTDLVAVYATGLIPMDLHNDHESQEVDNLFLSVFPRPDPTSTTPTAWIEAPQEGATVWLPKKAKGKVTLTALDGADGSDETYAWYEGGALLGSGASLTHSFVDGPHTVRLVVDWSGTQREDTATFTVATYSGKTPPTSPPQPTPGFTVSPTSALTTTESGGIATFTIVLSAQPTFDVAVPLSSLDTTEGTVSPTVLTFTSSNWNTPQTATVTGVDDSMVDGDQVYVIDTGPAVSGDSTYAALNAANVQVTNVDNDGSAPPPPLTFSSSIANPLPIPDQGLVGSTLTVAGVSPRTIVSLTVSVTITHERPSDLRVVLVAPGGGRQETLPGALGTFTMQSFAGQLPDGSWSLQVTDLKKKKTGTLDAWSISLVAR